MENRRFVALGDIIADFFYYDTKLLGVDGGSSRFNVIANLARKNCNCVIIGGCGNDQYGRTIIKRLECMGVDISKIAYRDRPVRSFHLTINKENLPQISYRCSRKSPINNESTWYEDNLEDVSGYCRELSKDRDVFILDSLEDFSLEIMRQTPCDKILDIGSVNQLNRLKDEQLDTIRNSIEILQLNEVVLPSLRERFGCESILDVYHFLNPRLIIVTYGRNGADFAFENRVYNKQLQESAKEVDATGAGDAFLSVFVRRYYDNSKRLNEEFIDRTFREATSLTSEVVQTVGARGHLYDRTINKVSNDLKQNEHEI